MEEIEVARLRRSFRSIRDGFSVATVGDQKVFIKHLSSIERGDIDAEQVSFFDNAVKKGLLSEKQQLEQLDKDKIWTKENEEQIGAQRAYIKNLNDTKANVLPWQLDSINEQIAAANKALEGKITMRGSVLGLTAEEFARRKLSELYICYSLYQDKHFDIPVISREEMNEYDDAELSRYVLIYNNAMSEVTENVVKKVAVTRFFQDLYSLCDKDAHRFFGRAIADLTYYQCDLMIYGRFFNHILTGETKPPLEISDDPDKIIEWHQSVGNAKKELEKTVKNIGETGGVQQAASLVGATKQDYEKMGMSKESGGPSLAKLAAEKGGKLNKEQLMAILHGKKV